MTEADRDHVRHIQQNSKVGLHLEFKDNEDLVIFMGKASVSTDDPPSDQVAAWVEKYQQLFTQRWA